MDKNIMNKMTPLIASPALKLGAKNEAKVSATSERLANSRDFSAYNLHWNSFIVMSRLSIAYEEIGVKYFPGLVDDVRIIVEIRGSPELPRGSA